MNMRNIALPTSDQYSWPLIGEIKLYSGTALFLPRH